MLYSKSDIDPLTFQLGKKDSISFGAFEVQGKPSLEVPRTVDPPLPIPNGRCLYGYPFNIDQLHNLFLTSREIIVIKDNFILSHRNQIVTVYHLGLYSPHRIFA